MDLNNSQISESSTDTDVLVKIPHNFFDPNLNQNKSYFSNDGEMLNSIDQFLKANQKDLLLNSTANDLKNYTEFADSLQLPNSEYEQEQDLNSQLISIFQKKIQYCQQKERNFLKELRIKDEMIRKLKSNEGLDIINDNLKKEVGKLQIEKNDHFAIIKKHEVQNEILERKIENLTGTSKEMNNLAKKQIEDLEIRLSNALKMEKVKEKEIEVLKENIKTERENYVKENNVRSQLDREVNNLKLQLKETKDDKLKLVEKQIHDKQATEIKQKKIFTNIMNECAEKERKIIKELELQRGALKNYYQAQLETALEEKVKEFQEQLENFQFEIKSEYDGRERLNNERFSSQLEMIINKNEEEIDLIRRKCMEEIDLYRIQLINASKTIEILELKLKDFQTRRVSIADNLHSIMETQWQKILDVLSGTSRPPSQANFGSNEISESDNNKQYSYDPMMMNNLSRSEENLKSDLLRNYVHKVSVRNLK